MMIRKMNSRNILLFIAIVVSFACVSVGQAFAESHTFPEPPTGPTPLDKMIVMYPINAFLSDPSCETEDQWAQKITGIPPAVSMHFAPVHDGKGGFIPFHKACLIMKHAWEKDYPNYKAPKIPWSVQKILIRQGAGIEWLILAHKNAIK